MSVSIFNPQGEVRRQRRPVALADRTDNIFGGPAEAEPGVASVPGLLDETVGDMSGASGPHDIPHDWGTCMANLEDQAEHTSKFMAAAGFLVDCKFKELDPKGPQCDPEEVKRQEEIADREHEDFLEAKEAFEEGGCECILAPQSPMCGNKS